MRAIRHFFTRHRSDDRGVVAIFTAIAMAVLVGFVGFAVDVGMVFNERRQEQSTADVAALSGARQWILGGATEVEADETGDQFIFDAVVELSHKNMNNPPPYDEWRSAFVACEDPDRPDRYESITVAEGTVECISKRPASPPNPESDATNPAKDGRALRVRLPDTTVDTAFARVVGFNEWTVSAFAEAGLTEQPGSPNIIPFALGAIGDGSGGVCLKTPTIGQTPPNEDCEQGSSSGNFGFLEIPRPSYQSNQNCNGGQWRVIRQNIAQGIDHALSERAGTSFGNYTDPKKEDKCPQIAAGIEPNHLFGERGNLNDDDLEFALIRGTGADFDDGNPARLKRSPADWLTLCVESTASDCAGGHLIDDKPLWEFFDSALDYGSDVPESCDPAVIPGEPDPRGVLMACLDDYEAGGYDVALLTDEILESSRFTWLPEAWGSLDGEWKAYDIRRFRPVFIQSLYYIHGNNWWAVDPGRDLDGNPVPVRGTGGQPSNQSRLKGMSAIAMQLDLLPQHIQDEGPVAGNFLSRIALIR